MKVNLHTFLGGSVIFDWCHLVWRAGCLRLKLVELNFFASFNADDQRKFAFLMYLNTEFHVTKEKISTKFNIIQLPFQI